MDTQTHLPRKRGVRRKLASFVAALAVAITAIGGATLAPVEPANAAGAPGAGGYWTPAGGWLGNYIAANGTRVYCIDVLIDSLGSGGDAGSEETAISPVDGTRAVSGAELQMMNYAISVHGQTADPVTAAAVSAYVYNFTSQNWHGNGAHYISGPNSAAITAAYNAIAADTAANYSAGGGTGNADLLFNTDTQNNYLGVLNITNVSPANATGSLTLTNGVFTDTGLATRDGVTNNSSFPVTGVPPTDDTVEYKISVEGAFTAAGGYASSVRIHSDAPQRTAGPGAQSTTNFTSNGIDPMWRSTVFQPVVGTKVASKFVDAGEEFADVLSFSTATDADGLNNPWRTNAAGRYAPITARGTLFGPFLAQPVESDDVPANAPVVATDIMVTTDAVDGPTVDYTVPSGAVSEEAGFYTWVWEILQTDQSAASPNVQQFLPAGYHFKDRFGQVVESSITPSNLAISTEVTNTEIGIGQEVADKVTVTPHGGGWLQADGGRVPATLTGTAYFSAEVPALSDTAPADAEVVGTLDLVVNKQGTTESASLAMPMKEGYVTFQWCLVEANQPAEFQGMIAETCDKYGQTSETVKVIAPEVATQAKQLATIYDPIKDTAIVNGPVPENTSVSFELFKKPVAGDFKRDSSGNVTTELWTEDEVNALGDDAVCVVENRVTTTDSVAVTPGDNVLSEYDSPEVFVDEVGVYWWIESLIHNDPNSGDETVIRSGECGLPNETTTVDEPKVTTKATEAVFVGEKAHDTASVTGPIPGTESGVTTELTFEAFEKTGTTPVCTVENRVHNLTTPVEVIGAGEYKSEEVTFDKAGDYFWVETLTYVLENGDREIVHVGECGLPDETTKVKVKPVLALTGATGAPTALSYGLGAAGLLALAGGALFMYARHRRQNLAPVADAVRDCAG